MSGSASRVRTTGLAAADPAHNARSRVPITTEEAAAINQTYEDACRVEFDEGLPPGR